MRGLKISTQRDFGWSMLTWYYLKINSHSLLLGNYSVFSIAFPNCEYPKKDLIELTFHCFMGPGPHKAVQVKHFTDLLKIFQLTSTETLPSTNYIYDELRYSATQLEETGVKFKVSSSKCLINLEFKPICWKSHS